MAHSTLYSQNDGRSARKFRLQAASFRRNDAVESGFCLATLDCSSHPCSRCRLKTRRADHAHVPKRAFDKDAVLYGAATHDLGKAIHFEELVQAGKAHERRGFELLQELGVSAERARFAFTHGNWETLENVGLEDLLVALADNCWKGKRPEQLESRTVDLLSILSGRPVWDCYSELDDILGSLAADADNRLAWQGEFDTKHPGAR